MKHILFLFCVGAASLNVGCESSGLSASDYNGQQTYEALNRVYTSTMQPATTEATFKKPSRLAVAQIGEERPPQPMLDELAKAHDVFSSVDGVPAPIAERNIMQTSTPIGWYRSMAAATHADYLLLLGGKADTLHQPTGLSLLNVTIVGMFFPTEWMTADVKEVGVIVDVRTGDSVDLKTAELQKSALFPVASMDEDRIRLLEEMRDKTAVQLAQAVTAEAKR